MGIKKIPFFDFSAVLDKLQAIADNVHPTASGTSITPTGMHIVTEDDVQGAISELDTAVDSVNSSLTQLESDVEQLEESQFTAPVDLSSYTTTSNVYTCPCDGYVVANAGSANNSKAVIRVYNPTMSQYFNLGGWSNSNYPVIPCFVKKGSKLQTMTLENGGNARFYPLNG